MSAEERERLKIFLRVKRGELQLSASNIVAQMCLHSSPRSKYGQVQATSGDTRPSVKLTRYSLFPLTVATTCDSECSKISTALDLKYAKPRSRIRLANSRENLPVSDIFSVGFLSLDSEANSKSWMKTCHLLKREASAPLLSLVALLANVIVAVRIFSVVYAPRKSADRHSASMQDSSFARVSALRYARKLRTSSRHVSHALK